MNESKRMSAYSVPGLKRSGMPPISIKETTAQKIINATCEYFNTNKELLAAVSRRRKIVYPRQCAIYLLTQYTTLTLDAISEFFGHQDHTTVIHSRRVIGNRLYVGDSDVREDINAIYDLATYEETIHKKR